MIERGRLIEKLVSTLHLNVAERKALGPEPVSRIEISAAILRIFTNSGRFPPHARPWQPGLTVFEGHFLELLGDGRIRLWCQRSLVTNPAQLGGQIYQDFSDSTKAIEEFITREWAKGNIDGIQFVE
jgi:hypothetical protein